jgi:hypothetical protein
VTEQRKGLLNGKFGHKPDISGIFPIEPESVLMQSIKTDSDRHKLLTYRSISALTQTGRRTFYPKTLESPESIENDVIGVIIPLSAESTPQVTPQVGTKLGLSRDQVTKEATQETTQEEELLPKKRR